MTIVRCPKCRVTIPMGEEDWPLNCACGTCYTSPAELLPGLPARRSRRTRPANPTKPAAPKEGPGKELKLLLTAIGFTDWQGCGCAAKVAQMNEWGADGCRTHRATIVGWLREAAGKTSWLSKLAATPKAATVIPAGHWTDPIPWLVDEAIRLAGGEISPAPIFRQRIDPALLLPHEFQFNNSLIRFRGKLLMAYRLGWSKARIAIAELDETYRPVRNWLLDLPHGDAQEDPRLWTFRGELHVSYTAYYPNRRAPFTDVTYARLQETADGWRAAEGFAPQYAGRDHWEKNWGFFEHAGELHCLYSIKTAALPFRVLRVEGERTWDVAEHACPFGGKEGVLHGGAPPVLHQGEYYAWFHRRIGSGHDKTYTIDLLTFEARPPFRPSRHVPAALLVPTTSDRPGATVPHAVFPGGAFLEHNAWHVAFGYYDKWSELARWDVNHIEEALQPLPGGPFDGLSFREDDGGRHVWKQVYFGNEYRLPPRLDGQTVVDVGAHVGSFSRACLDRGAALVVSCEPDTGSLPHLRTNLSAAGERSRIVPAYVSAEPADLASQYLVPMTPDAAAGRVDLAELLAGLPRVDWLKLDCEGPEHEMARLDLSRVRHIVGEVHRRGPLGIESFVADLQRQGFRVEWEALSGSDWLWNFWAERK